MSRIPPAGNHAPGSCASFSISRSPVLVALLQERRFNWSRRFERKGALDIEPGNCCLSNFYTQKMAERQMGFIKVKVNVPHHESVCDRWTG